MKEIWRRIMTLRSAERAVKVKQVSNAAPVVKCSGCYFDLLYSTNSPLVYFCQ